ncbi:MAG TPA: hypothetical protein VGM82_12815 [Gemmatimonadaceae bacterium]|jgi:hypothetical protein
MRYATGILCSLATMATAPLRMGGTSRASFAAACSVAYDAHVSSASVGNGAPSFGWVARILHDGRRGRVDFVSGVAPLHTGEYVLFDTTGAVLVRPASKTFAPLQNNSLERFLQPGMELSIADVTQSLDTATSNGPARHFRLTQRYATVVQIHAANNPSIRLETSSTVDYWLTRAEGVAAACASPFIDPPPVASGRVLMPWILRQRAAAALLPQGLLATTTVFHSETSSPGGGPTIATSDSVAISGLHSVVISPADLLLPDDFKPSVIPGLPMQPATPGGTSDAGAHWRVPPGLP